MSNFFSISLKRLTEKHGFILSPNYTLDDAIQEGVYIKSPSGRNILFKLSKSSKSYLQNTSQQLEFLTSEYLLNNGIISLYEFEDSGKGYRISIKGSTNKLYLDQEDLIDIFGSTQTEKDTLLSEMFQSEINHLIKWGILDNNTNSTL